MGGFYRFPPFAKPGWLTSKEQIYELSIDVSKALTELKDMEHMREATDRSCSVEALAGYMRQRRAYGMKLMDVIHAAETALRKEFSEAEAEMLREAVERKNREMGYYGAAAGEGGAGCTAPS